MTGYYRQFILKFSELKKSLIRLLQNDFPFLLEKEQESTLWALCEALTSSPVLVYSNFDKPFFLFTNVINVAMGAILAQLNDNKVNHHIAFYNKIPSKAEHDYSLIKRYCLAVLLEIKHFLLLLYVTHFKVVTKYSHLQWSQQTQDPDGRLA